MADAYVGEIRMFAGNFAPLGWSLCDGQLVGIADFQELFALIGTTYGGDGQTTFALPDLRGRVPIHQNDKFPMGSVGGAPTVTLNANNLPPHTHPAMASLDSESQGNPAGNVTGASPSVSLYKDIAPVNPMSPNMVQSAGGSQPHDNMQPYLCVNFIICYVGTYPSQ